MPAISVVHISWYLCVLFIFAVVAESAATAAPGGEAMQRTLMGAWATVSDCLRGRSCRVHVARRFRP